MSTPFFLTRQTANLMEDFTRELKAGASLFLLYGDPGIGKTRLMRELSRNRMPEARVHWLDLSARDSGDETRQDRSAEVEEIFKATSNGDTIIADHFESALQKTRHQLFLSWSTEGVDRKLNLIIASSTDGFNELRQLSQQYQVRVQSFQQMPFNPDEVEAFLGFYLFPEHPIGKLSIPADLRKQFAAAHGVVGQIIDIAERDGARIESTPMTDTESIRQGSRIIVWALILFALTIGAGWYYLDSRGEITGTTSLASNENGQAAVDQAVLEAEVAIEPEVAPAGERPVESDPGNDSAPVQVTATESENDPLQVQPSATAAETEAEPGSGNLAEPEVTPGSGNTVDSGALAVIVQEAGTATDADAVLVEDANAVAMAGNDGSDSVPGQAAQSEPARFARELLASMEWINNNSDKVGTIQIMMLGFETFDAVVFYEYVEYLASQQVDITQLRVFKTYTGNRKVYSVFYGEFDSWRAANRAKDDLPEVLVKTSPIPRSVGGIMQEIRRLEVEN